MADWTPTGTDGDLDTILDGEYACTRVWEAWQVGTMTQDDFTPMGETEIVGDLLAWRDAAVARFLAEAGAVHPAVHTPTRVMQWLGEHGWQAAAPSDPDRIAAPWVHRDTGYRIFVSLHPEVADYSRYTASVVAEGAQFAGVRFEQALLEIALLPDEVA